MKSWAMKGRIYSIQIEAARAWAHLGPHTVFIRRGDVLADILWSLETCGWMGRPLERCIAALRFAWGEIEE